ncbi:MAG: hypothetical protein PWP20_1625 [Eubacteriaceae bacterium]|nr:hypothetical protein [Eubacteriaceae bacterium]
MTRKKIILIRHGQPIQHQDKIFLGQTDIGLSDQGREDGQKAFEQLTKRKITRIYTSPLKRARETGEIICQNIFEQTGSQPDMIQVSAFAEMSLIKSAVAKIIMIFPIVSIRPCLNCLKTKHRIPS